MNYYFLVASLPMLSMEEAPPFSAETFEATCAEHLSARDAEALSLILAQDMDTKAAHPFVTTWRETETQLRNAVVAARAARHKQDPDEYLREQSGFSATLQHAVTEAFARENPLDRERLLDRFRWKQSDDLAGMNPFSSDAMLAYALKLKLAARWATMDTDKGNETAEAILQKRPTSTTEQE
jgi:hypothetical protein